jgi:hypothetical protein
MHPSRLPLLALLLTASPAPAEEPCAPVKPCEVGEEPPAPQDAPADLGAEARAWFDLLSCRATPAGLDAKVIRAFCGRQRPALAAYRDRTLPALRAALDPLRGARVPTAVVVPFSGPDLASALAAYPDARSVTTLSAVPFGDVRGLDRLRDPAKLRALLDAIEAATRPLLAGHGGEALSGRAPAFALFLTALAAQGLEPAGLRYFRLEPQGGLHFLTAKEVAAAAGGGAEPLASAELAFVRAGDDAAAGARVHRHVAADLSDAGLARAPGVGAYLAARGKVAVLVCGAEGRLSAAAGLRAAVLGRATVLLGDRTAPSAEEARAAGLGREVHPAPVAFCASAAGATEGLVVLRRP